MRTRRRSHCCVQLCIIVLCMARLVGGGGHSAGVKDKRGSDGRADAKSNIARKVAADLAADHSDADGDAATHGSNHYYYDTATHEGRMHGHGVENAGDGGVVDEYGVDRLHHATDGKHGVGGIGGMPYHTAGNGGPFGAESGGNMFGMDHDDPYGDFMHEPQQSIQLVAGACDPLVVDLATSE